jgi:hypothetical protein
MAGKERGVVNVKVGFYNYWPNPSSIIKYID